METTLKAISNQSLSSIMGVWESTKESTNRATLTADARRKVSFEEESTFSFDNALLLLNQDYTASSHNNHKRVVSDETIQGSSEMRKKSRSLPSLSRSGDLKSLLGDNSFLKVPSVSEECLSSSMHDGEEEGTDAHGPLNDSYNHNAEYISTKDASSACPSCIGWGQFVDFMPLEHNESKRGKHLSPRRRRRSSFSNSSKPRRLKQLKEAKIRLKRKSLTIYHGQNSFSTSDITRAFQIQLSFTNEKN